MLTAGLESTPLCSREQVLAVLSTRGTNVTTAREGLIDQFIAEESATITDYLGTHTLKAARTEEYDLKVGNRLLTLHARPVDLGETFTLLAASTPEDLATATALTRGRDYVVDPTGGTVRFLAPAAWNAGGVLAASRVLPTWLRITYTAGYVVENMGATTPTWLRRAAELQVAYRLARIDSLGGTVERPPGGGARFEGEFGLLKEVRRILDAHRRGGLA